YPDGTEVTVDNYALVNQAWELDHILIAASRLVDQGQPLSDVVAVFDPEDVRDPGINTDLSKEALEAAENLDKKGVRLWLIAAGPNPDFTALVKQKPETKDLLTRSIRSSLQTHGNDP